MSTIAARDVVVEEGPEKQAPRANGDFVRFWTGETVSLVGSQVTALALPLTAVVVLDASPGQMGLLGAAQTVPFLLFALLAGVWVDRRRRRPILVGANLGRGLLLGLVPLLAVLGRLELWHLLVVAFLVGACGVFFEVAYQSYLPGLVGRDELVAANGKLTASASVSEIGGPGLAGLLVSAVTAPVAILIDAVSFLVSAATMGSIRAPEAPPERPPAGEGGGIRREIGEGFRFTAGNRYLLAFAGEAATYNVFWNAMEAVLLLHLVRSFGFSAGMIGVVFATGAGGALLGALLTGRAAGRWGLGRVIVGSAVVSNVAVLLIPLAGGPQAGALGLLGLAFFLKGLGNTGCNVQVYSLRQALIPDRLQGRANAAYRLLTYGFIPLGALLGGWLGETLGLRPALWIAAIGLFPSWAWFLLAPVARLRGLPEDEGRADEAAPAAGAGRPAVGPRASEGAA